mgnify:CR=1 FL=1|nr:MAG TPA: hypothetical protein [Caudoviricetes sp.]
MREIKATFSDGTRENFGRFSDLRMYMEYEHKTGVTITVRYCLETIAENKSLTYEQVAELANKNEYAEAWKVCPVIE